MKKLVLAALAIGTMASCTKSNVQYEQPGEMLFKPVSGMLTKAEGNVTYNGLPFNIWAWWINPTNSSYNLYIDEGTFAKNQNNIYQGATVLNNEITHNPYYWPTTGSLAFAGYSPYNAPATGSGTEGQENYKAPFVYDYSSSTLTVNNYTQPHDVAKTVDFMWFDLTKSFTYEDTKTTGVPVVFKHALSKLSFNFQLKDKNTPQNWTIKKVELNGIETNSSKFTANGENLKWDTPTAPQNITVYSHENGCLLSGDAQQLENSGNGVIIIPQSCTPKNGDTSAEAELVVTYDLKTPVGGTLTSQTVTLPLSAGTEVVGAGAGATEAISYFWKPGKHYIYTITFGANEILISPTVTAWEDKIVTVE